ncbi:MAG: hypothetical protein ACXAD7_26175 [Candidatus Kariarchaeaceae archaeon]
MASQLNGKANLMACKWAFQIGFNPQTYLILVRKSHATTEYIITNTIIIASFTSLKKESENMIKIIPFFSSIAPEKLKTDLVQKIKSKPEQIVFPDDFRREYLETDFLLYFIGTGGTENTVAEFITKYDPPSPILLLSYDLHNSLPAAMETRTYLSFLGYNVRIIHARFNGLSAKIQELEHLLSVKEKISDMKLGLIGEPSDWLIASDIDRESVNELWGLNIIDIPIIEITQNLDGQIDQSFFEQATNSYVTELEVAKASSVADKLQAIVKEYNLQALSIKCFDLLSLTDRSACCGLSYLNNLGIVAGCEGDLPATITMAFLTHLSRQPTFMANVAHVDEETNHINIAHCTVATKLVENYDLVTHFESNKSVGIRGRFKTEIPITICKLFGPSLTDYWVSTGTIIRNTSDNSVCRTQLEIKLDKPVEYFLKDSFANHHIMALGDWEKEINLFFEIFMKGP